MKKGVLLALVLLGGCATDEVLIRPLPAASEPSTEVTVIRPRSIVAAEWPFYIVVADQPVFDLRNGENTRFRVSSVRPSLAIRCIRSLDKPLDVRIEQDLPPGGSAYFVVEPKGDCASVRQIAASAAASDLRVTRFRAVGTANPTAQSTGDAPAVFTSQPVPPTPVPPAPQSQVAAATAAWVEAFNSRDVARIASLYENDAVLRNASGQRIAAGPGGIAEYFRNAPSAASVGEPEIRVFGETAVASGASYNIVFRQRGGKWLIVDQTLR